MGDRCEVSVDIRPEDLEKVEVVFGKPELWEIKIDLTQPDLWGMLSLEYSEVNYAGLSDFEELARAGLTFIARSGVGGTYGPSVMVGHDGEFDYHTSDADSTIIVPLDMETGELSPKAMSLAQDFLRLYWEAEKAL